MENERMFYVWDVNTSALIGMRLTSEGIKATYNDCLSGQEITAIGSN